MTRATTCPHCGGDISGQLDGRAGWWAFRVRLYDMHVNPDEPMADSDADLSPDKPGETRVRGLWKVMEEAATAAHDWHGVALLGWSDEDKERKLRGVRPTLSRKGGMATIRLGYDTRESFREGPQHEPRYLARIDLLKTDGVADAA